MSHRLLGSLTRMNSDITVKSYRDGDTWHRLRFSISVLSCTVATIGYLRLNESGRRIFTLRCTVRAAVGLSDDPSTGYQRHIKESLAPLERILGASRHDG